MHALKTTTILFSDFEKFKCFENVKNNKLVFGLYVFAYILYILYIWAVILYLDAFIDLSHGDESEYADEENSEDGQPRSRGSQASARKIEERALVATSSGLATSNGAAAGSPVGAGWADSPVVNKHAGNLAGDRMPL